MEFLRSVPARSLRLQKRSSWKTQYEKIANSSKFHEAVRSIFISDSFFKSLSCYQEVAVQDLVPEYPTKRHHIDWYIDELGIVIELHGDQHFKFTNRGNIAYEKAVKVFNNSRYRDNAKKTALEAAGYSFIEIPYKALKNLDGRSLKEIILS